MLFRRGLSIKTFLIIIYSKFGTFPADFPALSFIFELEYESTGNYGANNNDYDVNEWRCGDNDEKLIVYERGR